MTDEIRFRQRTLQALNDELKAVVYRYSDKISLAEAVGVLEILKVELVEEHK